MGSCSAVAGRPRFDIADIVRRHRAALEATHKLTVEQRRVLSAIERCRTAALGGYIDVCPSCDLEWPCYHSCRNRHCPKCQALTQERWIAQRSKRLLPVRHFHVVFTLPSQLRPLARYRRRELYNALFAAASETLIELSQSHLGVRLGITMVLHTWTRELSHHPHVHAIVTAGGLALDGSGWTASNPKYLVPVQVMGALLRGKIMAALRGLHARGTFNGFEAFADPEAFDRLMSRLADTHWVVHAKKPIHNVQFVLEYLGRYTHRVAIANSRIVDVTDQAVTFRTKDGKTIALHPVEFLYRFVQHVLPGRFHKIRHYGLYSTACARPGGALDTARRLLPAPAAIHHNVSSLASWAEQLHALTGRDVTRCPLCSGPLARRSVPRASSRAPPRRLAA